MQALMNRISRECVHGEISLGNRKVSNGRRRWRIGSRALIGNIRRDVGDRVHAVSMFRLSSKTALLTD